MDKQLNVAVRESGPIYRNEIAIRQHQVVADEPTHEGGGDVGPTPFELLLGALGACTTITVRMYAEHKNLPVRGLAVRCQYQKVDKQDRIDRILVLDAPELNEEQRQRLLQIAQRCPVHKALQGGVEIDTQLVLGGLV